MRAGAGDGGIGRDQIEYGEERVGCMRCEVLPCVERRRRLRPGPLDRVRRHGRDGVRREREVGDDAEVPAAASAARPEEIGVVGRVTDEQLAGGRDDVEPGDVVRGRAEAARRVADAAAERKARDPDRRTRAAGNRDAVLRQCVVHVDEAGARADGCARARNLHLVEPGHVGNDDAVAARIARIAVAAAPRHDVDSLRPRPADDLLHIAARCAIRDRARLQVIEARIPEEPRTRVTSAARHDHVAVEQSREPLHRRVGHCRARPRRQRRHGTDGRRALQELAPVHRPRR